MAPGAGGGVRTTSSSSSGQMPSSSPVSRPATPSTNRSRSFCSASTAALVEKSPHRERTVVEALALQRLLEALHVERLRLVADRLRRDRAVPSQLRRGVGGEVGRRVGRLRALRRRRVGGRHCGRRTGRLPCPPGVGAIARRRLAGDLIDRTGRGEAGLPSGRRRRTPPPRRRRRRRRACATKRSRCCRGGVTADVHGVVVARADHAPSRCLHRGSIASDCCDLPLRRPAEQRTGRV